MLENLRKHPIRTITTLAGIGLIALTLAKDNVHFGSVRLNNPKENHYTWGLAPSVKVKGKAKGNLHTFGLLGAGNTLGNDSTMTGNMRVYGLIGTMNTLENDSTITGNIRAQSLFLPMNNLENSTITGDMNVYGLIMSGNTLGRNSTITGNMSSYSLIMSGNTLGENSTITGNYNGKGLWVLTPKGSAFGSGTEIGLENYVHKIATVPSNSIE